MKVAAALLAFGALAATVVSPTAEAAREFDTRNLSCARVNQIVQERGQVVMDTGPRTYQRFVANRGYCGRSEFTKVEFVPTADNPQCPVRWICFRRTTPGR